MKIIEIKTLENGSHRNQSIDSLKIIPEGWAIIPDDMETPNFPFGDVIVKEVEGGMVVTKWIPGKFPEPEAEPEYEPTEVEQLRADIDYIAIMTGVEL